MRLISVVNITLKLVFQILERTPLPLDLYVIRVCRHDYCRTR